MDYIDLHSEEVLIYKFFARRAAEKLNFLGIILGLGSFFLKINNINKSTFNLY